MVIAVPDVESFVEQAKAAGASMVWTVFKHYEQVQKGVTFCRIAFVVTAVGLVQAHAGGPEKALVRYVRDFGWTMQSFGPKGEGVIPAGYREKAEREGEEIRLRLMGKGFEVRAGEVEAI